MRPFALAMLVALGCIPMRAWGGTGDEARLREVYADLVRAAGDDRPPPDLVVASMADYKIALFDIDQHRITVEPLALSVCASFGEEAPAAMAGLLGHELGHYYLGHLWRADFGRPRGAAEQDTPELQARAEAQADRQAGYYAYMAGYPTAGILPRLLTALYHAYGLPDVMEGYPSLADRRRQASRIELELKPALWAWEAGKRLLLLGRPGDAVLALERAAQDFPSREVLCAAAEARLLAVQEELGPDAFPWTLPLLIDPRSRAAGASTQVSILNDPKAEERRQAELDLAAGQFQRSLLKAPGYQPAVLGLARVYLVQGRYDQAVATASTADHSAPDSAAAIDVVKALSLARQGRRKEAAAVLAAADPQQPWVAANLKVLRTENGSQDQDGPGLVMDPDEALGGWRPLERSTWQDAPWQWLQVSPPQGEALNIYFAEGAGVFAVRCVRGGDESMVAVTRPSYGGQSARGIRLGSDLNAVLKAYGQPQGTWPSTAGRYLIYRRAAFLVRDQKVREWMLF